MPFGRIRIRTLLDHEPLRALYGAREPFSWPGSADTVPVSAFVNEAGPHWHYVALGARDALGHDLTFRLAATSVDEAAPRWPVELLRRVTAHARGCEKAIGDGWYVCFEEPVDPEGALRCVALVPDPQLPDAMQAVGLHERELALVSEDGYRRFLGALREREPLLVTAPTRAPVLVD
ncbi:MAG: suppressor of fused domain protein [Sandaracinaceae bacterium]|nr:suppressor of fused domain protein [Sandaracinaceae bacterium]